MVLPQKNQGSSIGRKAVIAATGLGLSQFVLGHMAGNQLIFLGPDAINSYAYKLKHDLVVLLWIARIGLVTIFVLHLGLALSLWAENRRARPVRDVHESTVQATFASRSMGYTGIVVLAFVIVHIAHFTLGYIQPEYFDQKRYLASAGKEVHDVYNMMVMGLSHWWMSAIYIVATFLLSIHLSHGLASMFQTIGWNSPRFHDTFQNIGRGLAVFIFIGQASVPVAILAGLVPLY